MLSFWCTVLLLVLVYLVPADLLIKQKRDTGPVEEVHALCPAMLVMQRTDFSGAGATLPSVVPEQSEILCPAVTSHIIDVCFLV